MYETLLLFRIIDPTRIESLFDRSYSWRTIRLSLTCLTVTTTTGTSISRFATIGITIVGFQNMFQSVQSQPDIWFLSDLHEVMTKRKTRYIFIPRISNESEIAFPRCHLRQGFPFTGTEVENRPTSQFLITKFLTNLGQPIRRYVEMFCLSYVEV